MSCTISWLLVINCLPRFYTNDMSYGEDAVLCPIMARANHSCRPNAEFVTRKDLGKALYLISILWWISLKYLVVTLNYVCNMKLSVAFISAKTFNCTVIVASNGNNSGKITSMHHKYNSSSSSLLSPKTSQDISHPHSIQRSQWAQIIRVHSRYLSFRQKCSDNTQIIWVILAWT